MSEKPEAIKQKRRPRFLKMPILSQATTRVNDPGCLE